MALSLYAVCVFPANINHAVNGIAAGGLPTTFTSGEVAATILGPAPNASTARSSTSRARRCAGTSSTTVPAYTATEVEYNFQMTANATDNTYCFRASNGGLDLDNYTHVAELDMIYVPVVSNHKLNNDSNIALTEEIGRAHV